MEKTLYESPELELVELKEEDVITSSPGGQHAGDPDCLVDF
jgi:hypothetical protein